MRRLTVAVLAGFACASPGMPPGGPPDVAAPELIAITPDTGRIGTRPREVIFRFDEVVSERPPAATTLADLFLISPRDGTPRVSWNRDEIAVRPRGDWRPNTTYTVTMLGGLSDIRGNVRNTGASTYFSTGNVLARTKINGRVYDWVTGAAAAGSLIESFVPPDSSGAYLAIADSSGSFTLAHLPPGVYRVRAVVDRNRNRGLDAGEAWDSVSVSLSDSATIELLVFAHDSLPPRIREVASVDSLSLRVSFDRAVTPTQQLSPANFSVTGPDSVTVHIAAVAPPPRDTVGPGSRVLSRPAPITSVVITLLQPLRPGVTYRVRASGIRGLVGATGDSERTHSIPAPPPPTRADTGARAPATRPPL